MIVAESHGNAPDGERVSPKVTVGIPTYKRPDALFRTLDSVLAQTPEWPFEILVADNAPDESIRRGVEERARKATCELRYIPEKKIGLVHARHAIVGSARAPLIALIDDDVLVEHRWLNTIGETFDDPSIHLVGGPSFPIFESDYPKWMESVWESQEVGSRWCSSLSLLDLGGYPKDVDPTMIWGLNFAIRKATLIEAGGFHPDGVPWEMRRLRGDGETAVSRILRARGLRAAYRPSAAVHHVIPPNRLTVESVLRRAHLAGISDSYTRVRTLAGRGEGIPKAIALLRARLHPFRNALSQVRRKGESTPPMIGNIREAMHRSYREGFSYHQREVASDPLLFRWVVKPAYWE